MNHLHVRCPSCTKLYQVDVSNIFSTTPRFQCVACQAQFEFDFPAPAGSTIEARWVSLTPPVPVRIEQPPPPPVRLQTKPTLAGLWKELLENYNSDEHHQNFIMACRDLEAIEFAHMKYADILKAQGEDAIARQMLARIEAVASVAGSTVKTENIESKPSTVTQWLRFVILIPFAISLFLIVWGLSHSGPRNTVGTGIAIGLLSYGLIKGFFGPIRKLLKP